MKASSNEPTGKSKQKTADAVPSYKRGWGMGNIFWGLVFVLIGSLFLLNNLDVADVHFANLWQLWPLAIVAVGVSLIPVKGKLSALLIGLFMVASLTLVALTALNYINPGGDKEIVTKNVSFQTSDAELLRLNVGGGGGMITLRSAETNEVKAALKSSVTNLRHESSIDDGIQNVNVSMKNHSRWWQGSYENELIVTIPESLPVELTVNAGAARIKGDLSKVMLSKFDIDSGASDIEVKLGQKATETRVSVDVGVSSVKLSLPKSAGVRVEVDSGLSSKDFGGLKEVEKNRYESEGFNSALNKIYVSGSIGVASFDLIYY